MAAIPGRKEILLLSAGLASAVVLWFLGEPLLSTIVLLAVVVGGISTAVLRRMLERQSRL
jgi:hypothetical protein